jgi:hypothetical protein
MSKPPTLRPENNHEHNLKEKIMLPTKLISALLTGAVIGVAEALLGALGKRK